MSETFEKSQLSEFFDVSSGCVALLMYSYLPQWSWGKVMFLHVSVILFTGRGVSVSVPGSVSVLGKVGLHPRGLCPGESLSGRSLSGESLSGGLCLEGSLSGESLMLKLTSCHGDPPYGNEQVVRLILECILVNIGFFYDVNVMVTCHEAITRNRCCCLTDVFPFSYLLFSNWIN